MTTFQQKLEEMEKKDLYLPQTLRPCSVIGKEERGGEKRGGERKGEEKGGKFNFFCSV